MVLQKNFVLSHCDNENVFSNAENVFSNAIDTVSYTVGDVIGLLYPLVLFVNHVDQGHIAMLTF
jgi:hypothetical protein